MPEKEKLDSSASRRNLGKSAEDFAVNYLSRRGYRVIDRNWRSRRGEIDLICRDGDMLVFVEVKAAGKVTDWNPAHRIDHIKRQHLTAAAGQYLSENETPSGGVRFDALLLTKARGSEWKVEHIENAFQAEE